MHKESADKFNSGNGIFFPSVVLDKITPHIFRHTFTTRLVLNEVPYEITKTVLGHSSVKTTIDIYSHIKNENSKRMRADIGNVVKIF